MSRLVCTACRYVLDTRVFSDEESALEITDAEWLLVCPNCGETDSFVAVDGEAQSALDSDDPEEVEIQHTPYFRREDERIIVQIWTDDHPHPDDDAHHIESIGVYAMDGEPIEVRERYQFDPETEIIFDGIDPEETVEIRLACNIHGTWKGRRED